jgi:hypothetical protein
MRSKLFAIALGLLAVVSFVKAEEEAKPNDPYFAKFHPVKAPPPRKNFLKPGDRLAICGDSITEQRMYSRIMETYLTVCVPELNISVRQFGWSGERAPGFLARMTNDCLRFKPTIETTCYGMNDHLYTFYSDQIGQTYRSNTTAIVEAFKARGVRVIVGSPGYVGKTLGRRGDGGATMEDLDLNLCQLRNIDLEIAKKEKVGFADVFWPMFVGAHEAELKYGTNFILSGPDGIHPKWAGHLVMAYAFLHSLGLDGDIGTFTVDLKSNKAKVSAGHELLGFKDGEMRIRSHRYPFCLGPDEPGNIDNLREGAALVPFEQELNRLTLVVKRPQAKSYKVTWGGQTKTFTAEQLTKGINLADEFDQNPFTEAFQRVDNAVAAKQAFETREIKNMFHGSEGRADMEGTVTRAEQQREPLVKALKDAFEPVTHTIKIAAE